MLTALIIDDEMPSREELKALLSEHGDVEVIAECANAIEGLSAIHRLRPDVVFLDIQMPRVSGLEMVAMIEPSALPHIVFVTAYDRHALKAFEEHAADYLLKPIDPQRLARTLDLAALRSAPGRTGVSRCRHGAAADSLHRAQPYFPDRAARGRIRQYRALRRAGRRLQAGRG